MLGGQYIGVAGPSATSHHHVLESQALTHSLAQDGK